MYTLLYFLFFYSELLDGNLF